MRDVVGGLLALMAIAGLVIAVIALIRPMVSLRLETRARAAGLLAASIVLLAIAGFVLPPSETTTQTDASETEAGAESRPSPPPAARGKASQAVLDRRMPGEPDCVLTSETDGWEFIENNAARTADAYAVARQPMATFALATVRVNFQVAGEHEGKYLLTLRDEGRSFAQLEPTFDFCSPASTLDDERDDLWRVVLAKHMGHEF